MNEKSMERAAIRQKFADDLGLEGLRSIDCRNDRGIDHIMLWHWPKDEAEGRKYDRTIVMLVYPDGSFTTSLDDGHLNIEKSKAALRAMALATETI